MDHHSEMLAHQREVEVRRQLAAPRAEHQPLRARAARSLHHLARVIDTDDL